MLDPINIPTLLSVAAVVTTVCGAWLSIRKVARDVEKQRKIHAAEILQDAREADSLIKSKIDNRINELEAEIKSLRENVDKDIKYLKESSTSEFKQLSDKIENLREELRLQSKSILELLTKMIGRDN
jgi:pSer/pThr/pTyr-binding forkhead associated (FHA) protein